jgi:hypothetical protein
MNIPTAKEAAEISAKQVSDLKSRQQEDYLIQVGERITKAASQGLRSVMVVTVADIPLSQASVDLLRDSGFEVYRAKSLLYKGEYNYTISW